MRKISRWCVYITIILTSHFTAATILACDSTDDRATMTSKINAKEIEQLARKNIGTVIPNSDLLSYTPPLPETWPPSDSAVILVYAYASQPAPTGMVRYIVTSPSAAALIKINADATRVCNVRPMTPQRLTQLQTRVRSDLSASSKIAGIDALLGAMQTKKLNTEIIQTIRVSYRAWQREQSVIAENLISKHPEFFAWLAKP